jgi:Protein kinase domain
VKSTQPSCAVKNRQRLNSRWQALCECYLPAAPEDSLWRYSRPFRQGDAAQGWKLHISATVFNAHLTLERISPLLIERGVQFKAPRSLEVLREINSGLQTSYSQVGKVITVYPPNEAEAVFLARKLHSLTRGLIAPAVPFDKRYQRRSNVYYRYGAFASFEIKLPNGELVPAIRDTKGELVPDVRGPGAANPPWVNDPFEKPSQRQNAATSDSPLKSSFRPFRALSQRGKGGVYQAIDLTGAQPRLCLLKEGRRGGEVDWSRRDGRWRVRHEKNVIGLLRERGIDVPCVYSSFESRGNYYLVMEFLAGENLNSFLLRRQRRLCIHDVLHYACQLSNFIARLHAAGWIWRDCKPSNLIVTNQKQLKPLDFEGACRMDKPDPLPWVTPAFKLRRTNVAKCIDIVADDLYALGAVIYLLLTGQLPDPKSVATPAEKLRRNTPRELSSLLTKLLNPIENSTLDARVVTGNLHRIKKALVRAS